MGGDKVLLDAWDSISDCFSEQKKDQLSVVEQKYYDQLDGLCLDLWISIAKGTRLSPDFKTYLEHHGNLLLKVISNYLRRKLHIPKYSYMYEDKEQFDRETQALFAETPTL